MNTDHKRLSSILDSEWFPLIGFRKLLGTAVREMPDSLRLNACVLYHQLAGAGAVGAAITYSLMGIYSILE